MKFTIVLMAAFLVNAAFSFGQNCTPDEGLTTVGIYPGVAEGFDSAYVGINYEQVLQVYAPTDTTVALESLGGVEATLPINWFRIDGVRGMPAGFDYACSPDDCILLADE